VKEIGWGRVEVVDRVAGARWFGDAQHFEVYHWHGETFSIPPGAQHLLASPHCAHQAYALGKHFGLQCHVEMTEELVRAWCAEWGADVDRVAVRVPSVQTAAEMTRDLPARVAASNRIAATIYGEWIQGLRP
jgi:GMP synthase-like glutamine amidotransferase